MSRTKFSAYGGCSRRAKETKSLFERDQNVTCRQAICREVFNALVYLIIIVRRT